MRARPRLLLNRSGGKKKVSLILLDWGVRESFHALDYLNRQTALRDDYELIWLEFYDRQPKTLRRLADSARPAIDKWIVLGYPDDVIFHKHRLYNIGILAAEGDICVICDSDAIFQPSFVQSIISAFEETPNAVVHVDQVRNNDKRFYPFSYPTIDDILGPCCINWTGATTLGLTSTEDRIHRANYGACMAARRDDLLAVGGADEHLDYLGYYCGPYDLTFRLTNRGQHERWLRNEYIYHVWHPNQSGYNSDYQAPHDGRGMALRSLHAASTGQVEPYQRCPWIDVAFPSINLEQLMNRIGDRAEPAWIAGTQSTEMPDFVYWAHRDQHGFNLFVHAGDWFALPTAEGMFDPNKARRGGYPLLLQAESEVALRTRIDHLPYLSAYYRRFMRKVRSQPLHRLPIRAVRKILSYWPT